MAKIDLEKKETSSKGPLIFGLLALAVIAAVVLFFIFNGEGDDDEVGAGVEVSAVDPDDSSDDFEDEGEGAAEPEAAAMNDESGDSADQFPLAAVMDSPGEWNGRTVTGDVLVSTVPTDRGFWVEEDGRRAFFVVDPIGEESDAHIQQGQRLRITNAKVHQGVDSVGELEAESRQIIEGEPAFFVVDPSDFEIL